MVVEPSDAGSVQKIYSLRLSAELVLQCAGVGVETDEHTKVLRLLAREMRETDRTK